MMLNRSWLGNCLGIMDIKSLVGRLKRFLLGLGSRARARRARGMCSEPERALVELDMAQRSSWPLLVN